MKRWLSYRGVTEVTSLSQSTVRRLIAKGRFPKPVEVTLGRKVFDGAAVEDAMERLLAKPEQFEEERRAEEERRKEAARDPEVQSA